MSIYYKERADWLREALDSIMNQTILPSEIVLVKDGPLTSELDNVIDEFVIKYPNLFNIVALEYNHGLGLALNKGILQCKNELIARMDSDDYIVPNRFEKQIEIFKKNPDYDCIGSYEAEFEDSINNVVAIHRVPEQDYEIRKFMRRRCGLLHPTVMYKKSAVINAGNYRDVLLYEDYDLFMRMVLDKKAKCYNIPENLYFIRINSNFFKRRGGLKYMKTVVSFKNKQRKKGYISTKDFIISAGGQAIVCMMPNNIRRWFYLKYLR
ncbi:glycosyltransferase [Clostridium perfringens]|nr:glycosyltransferase [Clostridium perfringens]MDU4472321.1 glycosyltransferase [Clostridium perfringens]